MKRLYRSISAVVSAALLWTSLSFAVVPAPEVKAAPNDILFEDNFNDGNFNGWTTFAGSSWNAASGALVYSDPGTEAIIGFEDKKMTDYSFESRVKVEGGGYPGVLARMQDRSNFYMFRYDPGKKGMDLTVRQNNSDRLLQSASYNPTPGSWVTLKIVVKGNIIQGYVDGHKLIEAYDDTFDSGGIGFRNRWSALSVDDIVVREERRVHSDAETGSIAPWVQVTGSWSVVDNVYQTVSEAVYNQAFQQLSMNGPGLLATGDPAWESYYVKADVTPTSPEAVFGVAGRVAGPETYYLFRWTPEENGTLELVRSIEGDEHVLSSASYAMVPGTTYNMRLNVIGSALTGFVNGEQLIRAADSSIPSGAAGLWSNSFAYLDNAASAEMKDPAEAKTVVHWKFDPSYAKSGSLESGDLVLADLTNQGNDLKLVTVGNAALPEVNEVLKWSEDDYHGHADARSLLFNNKKTGPVQRYFETVSSAPMNDEQFPHGYTMEFIYKLPAEFSRNSHSWMKIFNRQGTGALAGKTQGEYDLLGQLAVSNLKELQWTYYTTELASNPTSWSFSLDSVQDWYHIALVNDGKKTQIYVNGVTDFRNAPQEIKNFAGIVGKGWDIGAASLGNGIGAENFLAGNLEEIRIIDRALPMERWLIPNALDRTPEYGNNEDLPLLQKEDNYNILFVPDIQKPIRYMPEIVEEQTRWIADHAEENNVVFTAFMGDIVDQWNVESEWFAANKAITFLDYVKAPYMTIAGNHDYEYWWGGNDKPYLTYFGKNRYSDKPYYTNESPSGYSSYSLFKAGSYEYMIIGSDWRDDHYNSDRDWIQQVLREHKTTPTILISHEILEFQGEQSTEVKHSGRGARNWNDFVRSNDQIFMTVSGHHHGAGYMVSKNDYGNEVLEVLADYQSQYHGGNGWMRFAEFDEANNSIQFHTFSPWVESMPEEERTYFDMKNLIGEKDRFSYDINFAERFAFAKPLYYVDSGSDDPSRLPPGEKYGTSNSVVDQPFGPDPATGKQWGYRTDGTATVQGGPDPWSSVLTDNGGIGKGITYDFEAPNGVYDVAIGFRSPVDTAGRTQDVAINGETRLTAYNPPYNTNEEKWFEAEVKDGRLSVSVLRTGTTDPSVSWIRIMPKRIPIEQIKLSPEAITLEIGQSYDFTVTVLPQEATESALSWTVSDDTVLDVSQGTVVAKKAGTAVVTVSGPGGSVQASATVTVVPPPVEKQALGGRIAQAKTLDASLYTSDSWSALLERLQTAESVYANGEATQLQIDEAERTLKEGIDRLVPLTETVPVWPKGSLLLKTNVKSNEVELTWYVAQNADRYNVWFGTDAPSELATAEMQSVTESVYSATIKGLAADTTYTFKVEAGNRYGQWTSDGPSLRIQTLKSEAPDNGGGGNDGGGDSGGDDGDDNSGGGDSDDEDNSGGGSGGNSSGGGSTPAASTQPSVSTTQLSQANNGVVVIEMGDAAEITLPADAAETLGENQLLVKKGTATLTFPSDVLRQLRTNIGDQADEGLIVVQIEPITLSGAAASSAANTVDYTVVGGAYDFDLFWRNGDEEVRLAEFQEPVELSVDYDDAGVEEALVGLYFFNESINKWEYVESKADPRTNTVTAKLSHFSTYAVMEWVQTFDDVRNEHWAARTIRLLGAKHLIQGSADRQFEPDRPVTRAEFIALLTRALRLSDTSASNPFSDVDSGAWYANSVVTAHRHGLIDGTGDSRFEPDRVVTREEMAALLVRAYKKQAGPQGDASDLTLTFKDREEISPWAMTAVGQALANGLMAGRTENSFQPGASVTRAEMAQAIYNIVIER
ncbi:S-layer homology domain-containing protein [Paenibacillus turpanensis]|uniref:S-layer homology domain-containing protein n=1 Tax=Paenibacillus turpanensis TaxID=2689078 RepID=UPI00140BCD79|nr:S-layer homology domain-containing protein [Paenibacillus turpanensis]